VGCPHGRLRRSRRPRVGARPAHRGLSGRLSRGGSPSPRGDGGGARRRSAPGAR
jgi:hypothetical protein